MTERRPVVCVSDHTGLTAATFAHSLVARFDGIEAAYLLRPFVDNREKVDAVVAEVDALAAKGPRPIVFSTLTDTALWQRLREADALVLGLFEHFVDTLAEELHLEPGHVVGAAHSIRDTSLYQVRLDALDFSLTTDDGLGIRHYGSADLIVIGVSRAGKTRRPSTCRCSTGSGRPTTPSPWTSSPVDRFPRPCAPTSRCSSGSPSTRCGSTRSGRSAGPTAITRRWRGAPRRSGWPSACSVRRAFPPSTPPPTPSRRSPRPSWR